MYAGWSKYQVSLETSDHPVQIQVKYLAVEIKARYWTNLASVRFDGNEIDTYASRLNSDVPPVGRKFGRDPSVAGSGCEGSGLVPIGGIDIAARPIVSQVSSVTFKCRMTKRMTIAPMESTP